MNEMPWQFPFRRHRILRANKFHDAYTTFSRIIKRQIIIISRRVFFFCSSCFGVLPVSRGTKRVAVALICGELNPFTTCLPGCLHGGSCDEDAIQHDIRAQRQNMIQ